MCGNHANNGACPYFPLFSYFLTSNTGYSGTMTMNQDGTGSGEIKNAGGTAVSTFTWDANGLCSVDYADAALADTQYYLTNVMAAMN